LFSLRSGVLWYSRLHLSAVSVARMTPYYGCIE